MQILLSLCGFPTFTWHAHDWPNAVKNNKTSRLKIKFVVIRNVSYQFLKKKGNLYYFYKLLGFISSNTPSHFKSLFQKYKICFRNFSSKTLYNNKETIATHCKIRYPLNNLFFKNKSLKVTKNVPLQELYLLIMRRTWQAQCPVSFSYLRTLFLITEIQKEG